MLIGTRLRKIYRDVVSRPTRTLLVATSIFVGVLGLVILVTMSQLVTAQLNNDLKTSEMAMLRIYLNVPADAPVIDNTPILEDLRQRPHVSKVEGQAVYEFLWKKAGEKTFTEGQLFSYSEPLGQLELEPIRLLDGRYPITGRRELAIERRMADKYGLKLQDSIQVLVNGVGQQEWRVVGIVFQPYLYIGASDSSISAYTNYSDAQRIVAFKGFSSLYVRFSNFPQARQDSASFRSALTRQSPYKIVFHLLDNPDENTFIVGVKRFSNVLVMIAVVAMVVASFLVTNVVSTIMSEQRRQIGAMKAIGASRLDLLLMYLGTAFVYGLIGTIPALILGVPLGQKAAQESAPLANIILDKPDISWVAVGLGLGMGLGVPILAALIPVYQGTKVSILEAMTDMGIDSNYGKGIIARWLVKVPLPLMLEQAIKNVSLRRGRLALTILSLTLAAAAFMGMFAVFYTLTSVVGDIRNTLNYKISLNPGDLQVAAVVQSLVTRDADQIRSIEPSVAIELSVENPNLIEQSPDSADEPPSDDVTEAFVVTAIDSTADMSNLALVQGDGWQRNLNRRGIVITQTMADRFQRSIGDSLHLHSLEKSADFTIIGISAYPVETAFMEWRQLADFVGTIREAPTPNEYWEEVEIRTDNDSMSNVWVLGIDSELGEKWMPDFDPEQPTLILSQAAAELVDLEAGDTLELFPTGISDLEALGSEISIALRQAKLYPIGAVVPMGGDELSHISSTLPPTLSIEAPIFIALYWADLATLVGLDYAALTPKMFYLGFSQFSETESENAVAEVFAPTPVHTNEIGFADRITQTILSMGLVMNFASLLMAIVGGIGLLTIMSITVFERQREIGVMRSVGASSQTILLQFLIEGLIVGLVAWLIAVPVSYQLSKILINAVPFREVIGFRYTLLAPVIGLISMLVMTLAATLYPSIVAARKTVSSILRYQ